MRFRPIRATAEAAVDAPHTAAGRDGAHVVIGERLVPRSAIRSVVVIRQTERDIDGQLFNFSVYLLIAAVFLIAVVEMGWRTRFLLATGFFAAVGLMSLVDVITANRLAYWRIDVTLDTGETIPLAVHTEAQRDRWLGYLRGA